MTFDETTFWGRIAKQNAETMATKPTTIGYTVESANGMERFTVRAEAERYLIGAFGIQPDTADFMLTNAYQTWCRTDMRHFVESGTKNITLTFDDGVKVTYRYMQQHTG